MVKFISILLMVVVPLGFGLLMVPVLEFIERIRKDKKDV